MEAERLVKTPSPTDKKAVISLPCSLRGALLAFSSALLLSQGLVAVIKPSWQVWSVWPGPHAHTCPLEVEDSLEPFGPEPFTDEKPVSWHILLCHERDRGLFSNTGSLNSFSFSQLRSALWTPGVWTHRRLSIAWVPI